MPNLKAIALATVGLLLGTACWMPMATQAQDTAEAEAETADPALDEERDRVRKELEAREENRDQQKQQICDQARAERERLVDVPARSVMRPNEDGSVSRMTEEEYAAHIEKMRVAETENCQ